MEELAEHAVKFLEDIIRQLRKTDRNLLKEREADVADLQRCVTFTIRPFQALIFERPACLPKSLTNSQGSKSLLSSVSGGNRKIWIR
jgi:hypothetical protein